MAKNTSEHPFSDTIQTIIEEGILPATGLIDTVITGGGTSKGPDSTASGTNNGKK